MKKIQYPARTPVAVVKRVDALELVVQDSHPHQQVGVVGFALVEVLEEIRHEPLDFLRMLRRLVDDFAGLLVLEHCSGKLAKAGAVLFQRRLDF